MWARVRRGAARHSGTRPTWRMWARAGGREARTTGASEQDAEGAGARGMGWERTKGARRARRREGIDARAGRTARTHANRVPPSLQTVRQGACEGAAGGASARRTGACAPIPAAAMLPCLHLSSRIFNVALTIFLLVAVLTPSLGGFDPGSFAAYHPVFMILGFVLFMSAGVASYVADYGAAVRRRASVAPAPPRERSAPLALARRARR